MVNRIITKGKKIFSNPQSSILSAATIIMLMIVASRTLGLFRQRALAHFFTADELSLFFAAFRLPDLVFEVLVLGTFSSAFIPVFTKLVRKDEKTAWELASNIVNIGLLIFIVLALLVILFAKPLYSFFTPGFNDMERTEIAKLTKYLFLAQAFFVVSYVLTGVLEGMKRFLVPALAPLFYNIGIILGIVLFSSRLELMAPVLGVLAGSFMHLLIQLPLAIKLGFRFNSEIKISSNIKKIGRLALPRVVEISFLQISKMVELFLASMISTASYTYYTFGNSLQLLPLGLFGTSIAKAALPTLAGQSDSKEEFGKTLWKSLCQMIFLISPIATILVVLRIPIVRLVYGTDIFTWEATVQTSLVVSAFALGVTFQAVVALLSRAFYALHDTKTPVKVSIMMIFLIVSMDFIAVKGFHTNVWGLALSFSIASLLQAGTLFFLISKRINGGFRLKNFGPFLKVGVASMGSGLVMYIFLKFFDKSVWVKRLSFLTKIETLKYLPFEKFVLDTRYTMNLIILTLAVSTLGLIVYLLISLLLKTKEVYSLFNLVKRMVVKGKVGGLSSDEKELVSPTPTDTNN